MATPKQSKRENKASYRTTYGSSKTKWMGASNLPMRIIMSQAPHLAVKLKKEARARQQG